MKIESSMITMNSTREYEAVEFTQIKSEERKWVPEKPAASQDKVSAEDSLSRFLNETKRLLADDNAPLQIKPTSASQNPAASVKSKPDLSVGSTQDSSFPMTDLEDYRLTILKKMLELLSNVKHNDDFYYSGLTESSRRTLDSLSTGYSAPPVLGEIRTATSAGTWVRNVNATHFLSEKESTVFSSVGIAKTQDGRELSFGIDMEMSRSFMKYTDIKWSEQVIMTDPLVINLGNNPASLSNQKFSFDIDSDGKKDNISYLSKGSGYLALDKNGDGKINNGSELFGTQTGNGFEELSSYDTDKNGWIDENDDIYNKLKVWIKEEDGTDKLINLKSADIGAIYLGSSQTDFTLKSAESGQTNGKIRRTGMYLKESTGKAQTAQQIDVSI
ncbi:hypothetical protein [Aminipila terrae]|uniref:VCBS repeat-containing protein n=1 Tax=Aminipila terrae TaxID=2697030 RepID=A0A6P1MCJ0_9FIRM|nr:hypothetical protein [Aminipila terrae]QHI71732.1 hypothetical protein Ami3637_04440 [Aminipila terrae]